LFWHVSEHQVEGDEGRHLFVIVAKSHFLDVSHDLNNENKRTMKIWRGKERPDILTAE
jgi:hypothetical protein